MSSKNGFFAAVRCFFVTYKAEFSGKILEDTQVIKMIYSTTSDFGEKSWLESLHSLCENIKYDFRPLVIKDRMWEFVQLLRGYLADGLNCSAFHEIKIREAFLLFKNYYSMQERAEFFYPVIGVSHKFINIVISNYLSAKNAQELARMCGYCDSIFYRKFKEEFNETPYKWMLKQTAKYIKGRLHDVDVPLKQIIKEFNFSSASHLNIYCKRYLGDTPSNLRAKYMTENQYITPK